MYGFEAIEGWERLTAVIPKSYMEVVNTVQAETNFWVNLGFISILLLFEYIGIVIYTRQFELYWFPILPIVVGLIALSTAKTSAHGWGVTVKAAVDLFLPDLCTKLQFLPPLTKDQERQLWTQYSQAILYNLPDLMPRRVQPQAGMSTIRDTVVRDNEDLHKGSLPS